MIERFWEFGRFWQLAGTQLWQITCLFGVLVVCDRFLLRRRRHFALLLWTLFFVKCLVPPVIAGPMAIYDWVRPQSLQQAIAPKTPPADRLAPPATRVDATRAFPPNQDGLISATDAFVGSPVQSNVSWHAWAGGLFHPRVFVAFWIAGSLVFAALFAAQIVRFRRSIDEQKDASFNEPAERLIRGAFERCLRRLDRRGLRPRLLVTSAPVGPLVFGLWRPTIVVPRSFATHQDQLQPIIAHELCHLWRRDHLLGWLQLLALTVFWFHPFVWLASRRVGQLCELCCDDDTVRTFGLKPIDYARGLLAVLSHRGTTRSATFALAIGTADVTRQRMEWILSENFGLGLRKSSMWIAAMLAVIVIPALGSRDLSIGLTSPVTGEGVSKKETMVEARKSERVDHSSNRRQMDFIVGHWDVVSVDGKPLGHSEFSLERSEKMIREDWQAIDGSTAQGITYYDATGGTWKMTWVDSAGTIVESSGRWNGDLLTLDGFTKSPNARKYAIQTSLKKETPDRMVSRMHVERSGRKILVSQSIYVRSDASQTLIGP